MNFKKINIFFSLEGDLIIISFSYKKKNPTSFLKCCKMSTYYNKQIYLHMLVIVNKILINYKINTMLKNVLSQLLLCFNFVCFIIVLIDWTIHIQNVIAGFYILK